MSLTLGEKLRQAREERGLTLGDVAEQTRISPLYIESIENDDYRVLPGGIFNKGFVKSYAKFVGINENEALSDYAALIAATSPVAEESPENFKTYRPEVLTDDRSGSSMIPTVILATVILGLMTAGILFFVNYMRRPAESVADAPAASNTANTAQSTPEAAPSPASSGAPDMASLKVEVQAVGAAVSVSSTADGKRTNTLLNPGTPLALEPRESLRLSYSRSLASNVKLTINGRDIAVPAQPLVPGKGTIDFEINKDNLVQIWENSAISKDAPAAATAANTEVANTAAPTRIAAPTPTRPTPRPTAAPAANTAAANSAARPANTARPSAPAANRPRTPAGNNDR